jgi:dipeptidase D
MKSIFSGLKPEKLWNHFEEILKIPHGSGNEKAFGDYIIAFAQKQKLEVERDKTGNVVVRKKAAKGHENAPGIVLQGHLDMVCEKNSDVKFDFKKDPIQAKVDGDWVSAVGTTLGSDNAIGVAAGLAVLEEDSLVHGPLECLYTVDEETGLVGARSIKPDFLKGRILLNLDSEDEGEFTIGCAGGADTAISLPLERSSRLTGQAYTLYLTGLKGGHSGMDIDLGRANAIKCLARILFETGLEIPFQLVNIEGGNLRNAIPREAFATVRIGAANVSAFEKAAMASIANISSEYRAIEPEPKLEIKKEARSRKHPLTPSSEKTLINFLLTLPHGVIQMHAEIKGLVETSSNLAVVKTHTDKAEIICSTRSSVASSLEATRYSILALGQLSGAKVVLEEGYPGWKPNLQSPILKSMKALYKKTFKKDAAVAAIHAGLECGIIGEKFEGMDMISFGPTIKFPHSPDEKVSISTVEKFWAFLLEVLKDMA